MDIGQLKSGLDLMVKAIGLLKGVKELLPKSPQKEAAEKAIVDAERAIQIAEASVAKELGFILCQCTWPLQIMTKPSPEDTMHCPKCGAQYEYPTPRVFPRSRRRSIDF